MTAAAIAPRPAWRAALWDARLATREYAEPPPQVRQGSASGARLRIALWALLLAISLVVLVVPGLPIATPSPLLAVAVATMVGAVGLALVHLSTLRYAIFGRPLDLFVGAAFWTLALGTVTVRLIATVSLPESQQTDLYVTLLILSQGLAAAFFLAGVASAGLVIAPADRTRYAARVAAMVCGVLLLATIGILAERNVPLAVDVRARQLIQSGGVVVDALTGQAPWLVVANVLVTGLLLIATIGYTRLSERLGDPHFMSLAVALTLLSFSQFHALLFPPISPDYVSTADALRLMAYVVLLYGVVARIGGEIEERVAREERLRLSRELHDGLAQQLSLLHLRLSRATEPDRPADRRARDVKASQRLAQAAMLEARQAITALRSGAVTWPDLVQAVHGFAYEFEQNQEVRVQVVAEAAPRRSRSFRSRQGKETVLGAGVQAEVLRILQEACSNAVQHGHATEIGIALVAYPGDLVVRVHDNGCGFDPQAIAAGPSHGVGLQSLQERVERRGGAFVLDAALGRGVMLQVHMPLAGRREQ